MTTPIAFGNLADPYAWLVRGLIEYNWEDLTVTPQSYPQTKGRGIDVSPLVNPLTGFGLRMVTLALDRENQWYTVDGVYEFEARLVQDPKMGFCILVRSDEMAFSQLFVWNTDQPMFTVGQIHETVIRCTHDFVDKRKRGDGISTIDLQEMLNHPIIPPPRHFVDTILHRLNSGIDFNSAKQEGLWGPPPAPNVPTERDQGNSALQNQQSVIPVQNSHATQQPFPKPKWTIQAGEGRGQLVGDEGLASQSLSSAMVLLETPTRWLNTTAFFAIFLGGLSLVNGMFTLYMTTSGNVVRGSQDGLYLLVIIISVALGLFGVVGGFASYYSNHHLKTISKHPLRILPIAFALAYPPTWWIGIPTAIWTLYTLRKSQVHQVWNQ